MTPLLSKIAELVDFDPTRFTDTQIKEEFNHKFTRSILKINGEYLKVLTLDKALEVENIEGNILEFTDIKSIEKVQPKTGLYSSKAGLLYLYRLPKRQWIKSIMIGSNYNTIVLEKERGIAPVLSTTVLIDNPVYAKESIIHKDNVYLHWLKVGIKRDNTIIVTNKNFFEEIKELWNQQYQVTLDANNPQQKDEKLILDF